MLVVSTVVSGILFACFLQSIMLARFLAFFYDVIGVHKKCIDPLAVRTPRQPTIYESTNAPLGSERTWTPFHPPPPTNLDGH